MNKKNEKTLVPRLRFPEFRDSGEWKERPISDLLIEVNRPMDMVDTEDYSLVTVKRRYGGIVTRGILKGVSIKVKSQFYIQENDFLISKRQIVHNACGVVPKELAGSIVSNEYSVLKASQDCDIAFFNYFSQQPIVSRSFLNCSIGIHIEKMLFRLNDWFKQEFLFPAIKEQQKIADCLSSLDELITAETQKLEAYKDHKKGLMQQLFPAEGETVPEWRFPEFRDCGEWKFVHLDKVVSDFIVPMRDKPKNLDGEIPWCRIEDFEGMYLYKSKSNQGVSSETVVEMNLKVYPEGTLLVSCSADLGRCAITAKKLVTNQTFIGLVPKVNIIDTVFLYYVMTNSKNALNAKSSGTTISYLSRQEFEKFEILISEPPEQQKIADCLSSLDELITAQDQKVETLKSHKKGLMQGLFPSADEKGV